MVYEKSAIGCLVFDTIFRLKLLLLARELAQQHKRLPAKFEVMRSILGTIHTYIHTYINKRYNALLACARSKIPTPELMKTKIIMELKDFSHLMI